ncbi:NUDIX hydrolase [Thioalkalivibrio denitrificans]|uniref:Phosphatase NudJ n=1 Tax=Thioalkalivibrio denitrificans TaxID=108003 RepID=A0A1V3N8S7_9GAMM|nr:NUDIX hydrolase [Thioalkalivibrio denitrificans]OOG21206.1 NUDIX hydrolase [Thioalkalivibrio denitrificans]
MPPSDTSLNSDRPWTPRVTVAAVVEREGRFLFVEESVAGETRINQPAGHLEDRESVLDAVVRETLEETAWRFTAEALVGIYRWRQGTSGETFLRFAFCGKVADHDDTRILDPEIRRVLWLDRDALLARRAQWRSPLVMRCVEDYLAGNRYPLEVLLDETGP